MKINSYIILIFSTGLLGNRTSLYSAELATAEAFKLALNAPWLVNLILVSALIGLVTSWNGFFFAGSRVIFALGRGKIIDKRLPGSMNQYSILYQLFVPYLQRILIEITVEPKRF